MRSATHQVVDASGRGDERARPTLLSRVKGRRVAGGNAGNSDGLNFGRIFAVTVANGRDSNRRHRKEQVGITAERRQIRAIKFADAHDLPRASDWASHSDII